LWNTETRLPKPQRAQGHYKYRHPLQTVPGPAGEHPSQTHIGGSPRGPEGLSRRALSHFPDKSVVIKDEQRGSGDHAGQDAFDGVDAEIVIDECQRAISEDKAYIQADQRPAPSKHKPHESADVAVLLHAIAIVDPDQRQVLHVVKDF